MQAVPACCSEPHQLQPWPARGLPDLWHCSFDPARLSIADLALPGLQLPARIATAAAKRQSEYLAGRLCARAAIAALGHAAACPVRGEDGAPQWPAGLLGSITHSHGQALAMVGCSSQWRAIGLDAERLLQPQRARRLASEILVDAELAHFEALWGTQPQAAARFLTAAFSAKESLFKALYPLVGQRFHFPAASVSLDTDAACLQVRLRQSLAADWPAGSDIQVQLAHFDDWLLTCIAIPLRAQSD